MRVHIKDAAEDNLRFIRGAMARAERTSSHSGIGGIGMGVIALGAMVVASRYATLAEQLTVWTIAAPLAAIAGAAASWVKARTLDSTLVGDPGRRFLLCLVPALAIAALQSWVFWNTPQMAVLPWLWMLLYGCGLLAAGTYAAQPIMLMGACFLAAGLFTFAAPAQWANLLLGAAFGGLHIIFGYQVYRHHGG